MLQFEYYTSINQVPGPAWNHFASRTSVGLETGHLRAIEESRINDIHPYYIIGYDEESPVGIAYCFSIRADLSKMANDYPQEVIETVKSWKPGFMDLRIVEVGHLASLGSTIEVEEQHREEFLRGLSDRIDEIAKKENADLCIIRDIDASRNEDIRGLEEFGYKPAMGYPVARMPLEWNSFDGYLASVKSKKRNHIRQKRSKLLVPEISVEIIRDYAPYSDRLAKLWNNVASRQDGYKHEQLTPAYFESMSGNLQGRSHVVAIKRFGEIIAFGLNLVGDTEYFGVAAGMEYSLRDQYDLYANIIFEGLRVACELGKSTFNLGITSYEFKTSIGAGTDPTLYLVRSFKDPGYSAVYADLLQRNIRQPENKHRVFKNGIIPEPFALEETEAIQHGTEDPLDPFAKHYRYMRADFMRAAGLYAFSPVFESAQEPVISHNGRQVIMLGTNSYLGLATHPKVKEAAREALEKYGTGCSGSPMLNGTLDLHEQLSRELARFAGKQDALIYSTGYQTNVGAVSALVNRDDVLIMDERNHASLVDGALLSRATVVRYKHNDPSALEAMLTKYKDRPKMVVTDSLFSMEGTLIDLPKIVRLCKQFHARLMLDESHAIGVIGPKGHGVAEHYGLADEVDIIMGTFSKSFASIGGFIAGDRKIIDTMKHTSRSRIFSASLPPASVAAVLAAARVMEEEPARRTRLLENARFLADGLISLGYQVDYHGSAIIPVFCGNELLTVAAFHKLLEEGVFVNPVTYPAVPRNQEMLRVSLMATHNESMLLRALEVFKRIRTVNWPARVEPASDTIPAFLTEFSRPERRIPVNLQRVLAA